jgi:hypothetical protein
MGRTLPSTTIVFQQEEQAFSRFRRALRRADQLVLDDLFVSARQHLAAAQYASHALPFEVFLLSMLIEEHKEVMKLRERMDSMLMPNNGNKNIDLRPPRKEIKPGFVDPGYGINDNPESDLESGDG